MRFQADIAGKPGARSKVALGDVSVALCAGAILLATLLAQPDIGSAVMSFAMPAAEASVSAPRAATATEDETPYQGERTVFLPELFLPVGGDLSVPVDQF